MEYSVDFKPRYGHRKAPHGQLYSIINQNRDVYSDLLHEALNYTTVFHSIHKQLDENNPIQPAYNNQFLPGLDIIGIYILLAKYGPKRYI